MEVFLESYKVWFAKVVPEIVSFSVTRSTFFSVFTEHFYLKGIHFRTTRLTGNIFIGDFWRMYQTYQSKFTEQGTDQRLDRFHEAFETMCSRSTGRQVSLSKIWPLLKFNFSRNASKKRWNFWSPVAKAHSFFPPRHCSGVFYHNLPTGTDYHFRQFLAKDAWIPLKE